MGHIFEPLFNIENKLRNIAIYLHKDHFNATIRDALI
jgi:hypothetical protein